MNEIDIYNKIEAAMVTNALPRNAKYAWMAAGDNASGAIDSVEFKRSTVDSLQDTGVFCEDPEVQEYFAETFGYRW